MADPQKDPVLEALTKATSALENKIEKIQKNFIVPQNEKELHDSLKDAEKKARKMAETVAKALAKGEKATLDSNEVASFYKSMRDALAQAKASDKVEVLGILKPINEALRPDKETQALIQVDIDIAEKAIKAIREQTPLPQRPIMPAPTIKPGVPNDQSRQQQSTKPSQEDITRIQAVAALGDVNIISKPPKDGGQSPFVTDVRHKDFSAQLAIVQKIANSEITKKQGKGVSRDKIREFYAAMNQAIEEAQKIRGDKAQPEANKPAERIIARLEVVKQALNQAPGLQEPKDDASAGKAMPAQNVTPNEPLEILPLPRPKVNPQSRAPGGK